MKLLPLASLLVLPVVATAQSSNVRAWPMPDGEAASSDFTVEADSVPVFVCLTHVAPADAQLRWKAMDDIAHSGDYYALASFASFDLSGPVKTVRITYREDVKQAKILPTSYGIIPVIEGRNITFPLDHPANLTIECNGDTTSSLHLFANPPETNIPGASDTNTIYFAPGIHEVTNTIKVASGQTLSGLRTVAASR